MNGVLTMVAQKSSLDRLVAAGGILETPTLILFQNNVTPNERTVMADLEECDFTGYADVDALEFGAAYQDDQDNVKISAPSVQFTATGSAVGNVVHGWAVVKADKTVLYYAELFDEPISIDEDDDAVICQPTIAYGAGLEL